MSSTPTSNAAPQAAPTGRDSKGRFAAGNPGGPGNPYARQVAAIRRAMADFMTPERTAQFMAMLFERSMAGDMAAAKILALYTAGKSTVGVDPDRLAMDEWMKRMETAVMMQQLPPLLQTPDPALPLGMVREAQPLVTRELAHKLGAMLENPEQYTDEYPDLEMADDDGPPPSPNGGNGAARPSPNGPDGRAAARTGRPAPLPNGGNGGSAGNGSGPRRRTGS